MAGSCSPASPTPPLPALDEADGLLLVLGWVTAFVLVGAAIAGLARLLFLRDATVVAVAVAGLVIGSVTAARPHPDRGRRPGRRDRLRVRPVGGRGHATNGDAWLSTLRTLLLFEPLDRMLAVRRGYCRDRHPHRRRRRRVRYPQGEWLIADDDDFALRVGTSMRATRW